MSLWTASSPLLSQDFEVSLEISSSLGSVGGGLTNLEFGMSEGASDGFVPGEDEYANPASGAGFSEFHAWIDLDGDNWTRCILSSQESDTFAVISLGFYQTNPIFLQWSSVDIPETGNFRLEDAFGGSFLSIDLREQNSILIDNIALTTLILRVTPPFAEDFIRGDFNQDQTVNLADTVATLEHLFGFFQSTDNLTCPKAGDINDDGDLNISDPIFALAHLFNGAPAPGAPFPTCGKDTTPDGLLCQQNCP